MEDYNKQFKRISSYVKNTKSSLINLEGYLRFEVYGLILDFDCISRDFLQCHPNIFLNTIYAIKNVTKELVYNRTHTKEKKTYMKFLRKHIQNKYLKDEYKKEFDLFFRSVCRYNLKPLDKAKIYIFFQIF
ncbi:hypothetical protein [Massilimicrobiota sp. SW1139]|uniref:hypothetical protein n=1 Tax=Bacillota TaxID=1239 RepID=UPI00143A1AB2|nr:hypothetical protein [Massilimicrobiota sp. SW1139]NJE44267.1 hypothetical protein [Massilimicrobiota sp. SW1139]